jgi:hypothetical protein
MFAGRAAAI